VFEREIVRVVHNEELRPILVKVPHEFGLASAPMPPQRQAKCRKELVAQRLLIFDVFRSHHRKDRAGASRFEQVANAHCFACARISNMVNTLESEELLPSNVSTGTRVAWENRSPSGILFPKRVHCVLHREIDEPLECKRRTPLEGGDAHGRTS
jgi:hypothetical protein